MYDSIAILKGINHVVYDEYLNEIILPSERKVFVKPLTVYSSEFYAAAQAGLHPSMTFELSNRNEYKGEKIIEFEKKDYKVIRVDWTGDRDKIRLICEEQIGLDEEGDFSE